MKSVRRSLTVLLFLGAILIALVGVVGGISALNAARAVDQMVDTIRPAAVSTRLMRQDALVAGASVRAFALSGDETELGTYRRAVADFAVHSAQLHGYLKTHPDRRDVYERAVADFNAWVEGYGAPRVATGGGPDTYQESVYRQGQRLFADATGSLDALAGAIETEYAAIRERLHDQLRATVALIAVTTVVGVIMLVVLGLWIARAIQRPLEALAEAVRRLKDGEYDVRAVVTGPVEVQGVAAAVNEFAVENGRAREMEERVQRELRDIDRTRTEFVSNVSHELRTPLTIINGNLELLEDDLGDSLESSQRWMLSVSRRNVDRLSELIEDLLMLNKAESSGTTLDLVDFQAVVGEVVVDLRVSASSHSVAITQQRLPHPVIVLGDANQLRRTVLNVVSNAIKFSSTGSEVRLELESDDHEVRLRVVDTGMGIPADELDQIGTRFFRASNAVSSEIAGTGLGLRIVQTIVHNHHGTVALASEAGKGTTVTITLPLADPVPVGSGEQSGTPAG